MHILVEKHPLFHFKSPNISFVSKLIIKPDIPLYQMIDVRHKYFLIGFDNRSYSLILSSFVNRYHIEVVKPGIHRRSQDIVKAAQRRSKDVILYMRTIISRFVVSLPRFF